MHCRRLLVGLLFLGVSLSVVRAGTLVQFRTTVGNFDVELFDADKPLTTGNFLRYVTNGLYTNMIMHRVVTNFVIQGGAIAVTNRGMTNFSLYYIPTFPPITNEFSVGKFYSNTYGTIAMAKTSNPNSATSQFFFNLTNNAASLDNTNNSGGFTVFGHVVSGTNSLNAFKVGPTNKLVKEVNLGGALTECPVRYAATNIIYDNDFIYVDISVMNVSIAVQPNGTRQISWNSVSNKVNQVEFTTNFPPTWQVLVSTNGTGATLTVSDSSANAAARFYRVRVMY
jgi:peptidyl-prolyl cis-trans isomerase A (cyclophilin A)